MRRTSASMIVAGLIAGLALGLVVLLVPVRNTAVPLAAAPRRDAVPADEVAATRATRPAPGPTAGAPAVESELPARREESTASASAASVLGTVVGPGGAPVAGAEVTLYDGPLHGPRAGAAPRTVSTQRTDEAGRYRFAVPPQAELLAVRVKAAGFAPESRNQAPGVDVPLELDPVGSWVGRLVGEGAQRARVLRAPASETEGWVRLDDGAGAFALAELPVGKSIEVRVVPEEGFAFMASFELPSQGEHRHDIELGAKRRLEGRVLHALARAPLAGASLYLDPYSEDRPLAATDAKGRFALVLQGPPASASRESGRLAVFVTVRAPGFFESTVWLETVVQGRPIELVPTGRIEGRVLAADGKPAPGAEVRWIEPRAIHDERFGELALPPDGLAATTDAEGRFELAGVFWGIPGGRLVASAGERERWVHGVAPDEPGVARTLEIRLPESRALQGQVKWGDLAGLQEPGIPALRPTSPPCTPAPPRVTVILAASGAGESARCATDEHGAFHFEDVPPGQLWLGVEGQEQPWTTVHERAFMVLQIPSPKRELHGALRASDGRALASQQVASYLEHGRWSQLTADTDHEGVFTLSVPDFPELVRLLSVSFPASQLVLEREARGAALDWTLPELVPVEIELGLEPARERLVVWRGPGADERGRITSRLRPTGGRLALALPAGTLDLEISLVELEPRRTERASVTLARTADGLPARISLAR